MLDELQYDGDFLLGLLAVICDQHCVQSTLLDLFCCYYFSAYFNHGAYIDQTGGERSQRCEESEGTQSRKEEACLK